MEYSKLFYIFDKILNQQQHNKTIIMKIYYSPFYDGEVFLGDKPKLMGVTYVGNAGLLDQLQLRAGIHSTPKSDIEREADYLNAMKNCIKDTMFEKAFSVDQIGVAGKLLKWRDSLIMIGWDGECDQAMNSSKIAVLASIEKNFHSFGVSDCWKETRDYYRQNNPLSGSVEFIQIDCPWSEIPYLIQETLNCIKTLGTELKITVEDGSNTPTLDIDKIKLVEFDDVNDAYEWFATIDKLPADTVVINRDNIQLNHTLYTWNKPQVQSSLKDSNPQLLQLFKLSMSIFSHPLNIKNLVSYLMLPISPIPRKLRSDLAKLLLSKGGFGDKITRDDSKVRDDWDKIIEEFEFLGKDGNDSPQAKGQAKAKKMPFLLPIKKDYSNGVDKAELTGYIDNLKKWIIGKYADEELSKEHSAQYHELGNYLTSFNTALQTYPNVIEYSQIEKLIIQIYRPMNYSYKTAEAGSYNIINDIRSMAKDANTLIWLDCQEDDIECDQYDFLNSSEREYLTLQKCAIPDYAKHLKTRRSERLRLINKCRNIILVRSKHSGTDRLGEHSMIAEVKYVLKKDKQELKKADPNSLFQMTKITTSESPIETFQPQKAYELNKIRYKGRVESNTSLDTLINYPFDYVMEYVAKLPVPNDEQIRDPHIATGLIAHNFFEHIITDSDKDINKMRQLTDTEFDSRLNASIDATGLIMLLPENASKLTEFRKQLKDSMHSWIDIMEAKNWTPIGCEFTLPEKGDDDDKRLHIDTVGNFGARIDLLLKHNDSFIVIDFKWSYSKSYNEKLEKNNAIQLELYRQAVLASYPGKDIEGVGYYLMPRKQLVTADFNQIPHKKLINHIEPEATKDLFEQIKNSYEFRMEEIKRGYIEEAEMIDVKDDEDGYYPMTESNNLCPLNLEEKTEGQGRNKVVVYKRKKSVHVFKQTNKNVYEKDNLEPNETATSHATLKGRLK